MSIDDVILVWNCMSSYILHARIWADLWVFFYALDDGRVALWTSLGIEKSVLIIVREYKEASLLYIKRGDESCRYNNKNSLHKRVVSECSSSQDHCERSWKSSSYAILAWERHFVFCISYSEIGGERCGEDVGTTLEPNLGKSLVYSFFCDFLSYSIFLFITTTQRTGKFLLPIRLNSWFCCVKEYIGITQPKGLCLLRGIINN